MPKLSKLSVLALLSAVAIAPPALAVKIQGTIPTKDLKKEQYADAAKVSLANAVHAAIEGAPGKAVEAELDAEDGFLVYEVKVIGADHRKAEVLIDAGSEAVLHVKQK